MQFMLNAVKEELLDYATFVGFIKESIKEKMGQGYSVRIYKVMKNNSLELDSLVVLKEGDNFAPNIYLSAYYESYMAGTSVLEIVDRLCMVYKHCAVPTVREDFEYSLELMRPYIFFRLISIERNKKLLSQIPYIEFLDLAITFHCLVRSEAEGIGTIRITNDHIKQWDITPDGLKELAFTNTIRLFPPTIKTMDEVIRGLLSSDNADNETIDYDQQHSESYPMYILTNNKGINGASCLLYKDVIREFAQLLSSDLYILPSSIHEIILIPFERGEDKERFRKMVMEINCSQVPTEEVLSDHVYMYSLDRDAISM